MLNTSRSLFAVSLFLALSGEACLFSADSFSALPDSPSSSMRYAPPEASFNADNQLQLFQDEIDQKQFGAAATRLDSLLRDSGDALIALGEDASVLSISAWAENLPAETKNALRPASEALAGAAAKQAVEAARARSDTDPAAFYALARRYPLTQAASAALAEAARRSASLGDVPSARWMLDAAIAAGWLPNPSLQNAINQSRQAPNAFVGTLPFAASWYGSKTRQGWAALRSFPVAADDKIFVVGPNQIIAMTENGDVLWKGPRGPSPVAGRGPSAPIGVTRGPPFTAALLCDAAGRPQIVVARQPQLHLDGWAIRALRASDGRLLWTTEGQDDYRGLVFGSNPAIEGRYVYAIAGEMADQLDHLWFVAIEATTGRLLWRCDIGSESRAIVPGMQVRANAYRPWLNESAPLVAGDLVIATPDAGAVIAVGRFDGKLRWTRGYPTLPDPTFLLLQQRRFAMEHPSAIALPAIGLSQRWATTPAVDGNVVVAAPQDSDQVMAFDLRNGKPLWQSADLPEATLVGISTGIAILAGETVTGITASTGEAAWNIADQPAAGPCVLCSGIVLLPTQAGVLPLSAEKGLASQPAQKVPSLEAAITAQPAHDALLANDVAHCFGTGGSRADIAK